MSTGSILVGLAIALITITYIARPFRRTHLNPDRIIENWVQTYDTTQSQPAAISEQAPVATITPAPTRTTDDDAPINFCHNCGRKVQPDHRFCPSCGTQLYTEAEV